MHAPAEHGTGQGGRWFATQTCATCHETTARYRHCMHCAALLRPSATAPSAEAAYRAAITRFDELMVTSRKATTIKKHTATFTAFARFCRETLLTPAVQASPADVVAWLVAVDGNGHDVVHVPACDAYRPPAEGTAPACTKQCPRRLAYSSVKNKVMELRAYWRDCGLGDTWTGGALGSGNPAASAYVETYRKGVKKEQFAAGRQARQAPMFSSGTFLRMVRHFVRLAAQANKAGDTLKEYSALQGATLLSFLFHCPDRCCDVTDRRWGDLRLVEMGLPRAGHGAEAPTPAAPRMALVMDLGIHKTAAGSTHSRTVALPATGDLGCPVSLYKALHGAHGRLFAVKAPYPGPVLRAPESVKPRKGAAAPCGADAKRMGFQAAQSILRAAMGAAGLLGTFDCRPHSFRASGAWDALQRGEPQDEILHKHNWSSPDMLNYYTQLRTLFTTPAESLTGRSGSLGPRSHPL